MAFSYEGLQKITGEGLVDTTIVTADVTNTTIDTGKFDTGAITNAKLANSSIPVGDVANQAITADKLANNAIDLAGSKISGALSGTKGGTGLAYGGGSARRNIRTNSSGTPTTDLGGLSACRVYTGNTTWTKPAGVTRIRVQVIGGGGGGTGHGEAGGSGGYAEEYLNVTSISSVSISIGGGGGGVNYHNSAGNGGTTSFGPYLSASGGEGARRVGGHSGGRPGVGSGGNLNIYGGGGAGHTHHGGGAGGNGYFGGSSIGVHDSGPQVSQREGQASQGTGGTGAPRGRRRGGTGRSGMVVVWEYK